MSDPSETDSRPDFFDLWKEHHFDIGVLSQATGVPEETIVTMLRYQPVGRLAAEKVLAKLSQQLGQNYSLETVNINLFNL